MKLTEDQIKKLRCPAEKKDLLMFDEGQRGLAVRVSSTGSKTFLVQYSYAGEKRRVPLGSVTLAKARSAAPAIFGDVAKGRDPAADRKQATLEAKRKAAHEALTLQSCSSNGQPCVSPTGARATPRKLCAQSARLPEATSPARRRSQSRRRRQGARQHQEGRQSGDGGRTAAYDGPPIQWAIRRGTLKINPFTDLP